MMPFLRFRASDRFWRLSVGFLWLPAIIVVITIEDWLHLGPSIMWISLGALGVAFVAFVLLADRGRA